MPLGNKPLPIDPDFCRHMASLGNNVKRWLLKLKEPISEKKAYSQDTCISTVYILGMKVYDIIVQLAKSNLILPLMNCLFGTVHDRLAGGLLF